MRRTLFAVAVALLMSPPIAADKWAIRSSWGKPGVSYDQYRADGLACGRLAYYHDVSDTVAARSFVEGSKKIDEEMITIPPPSPGDHTSGPLMASRIMATVSIVSSVHPEQRMHEIKELQESILDTCLAQRGYRRFRLTDAQTRRLGQMKIGREDRHLYLYSLAHDPAILAAQREDVGEAAR